MKKTLILVGAPINVANEFKESRPLAHIHFKRSILPWIAPKLKVQPVSKELVLFAREVERRIKDRLENHPDDAFIYSSPTPDEPHARKVATANDPNLLEAILGDPHFWNEYSDGIVAGHYVLSGYSKIEDR